MHNENEIDDFANDKEIIKSREELAAFNKMMAESIDIVSKKFNGKEASHKNLKGFILHKSIDQPFIGESYEGKYSNRKIYYSVFYYHSSVRAGRVQNSGTDNYFCGVIQLNQSYPHTIAQPETLALKIENLLTKTDVDFAHAKKFSRKFHVISKDAGKLKSLLQFKELNILADFPEAEFELLEKQCYFRASRKPVNHKQAELFAELAKAIFTAF